MAQALHDRIRSHFEARIRSGRLMPGDRLPTESELIAQYDCSRMTVNKALTALAAAGLVERRKRGGTLVAHPRILSMVLQLWDFADEIRKSGHAYRYQLLKRALRLPKTGEERLLAGGKKLLQVDGLHLTDGTPFGFETRLISVKTLPGIVDADFGNTPPGTWLLEHIPWTDTETRISALHASGETAKLLQLPLGTACLSLERRIWHKTERFSYAQQIFGGGTYDLVMHFTPGVIAASSSAGKRPRKS